MHTELAALAGVCLGLAAFTLMAPGEERSRLARRLAERSRRKRPPRRSFAARVLEPSLRRLAAELQRLTPRRQKERAALELRRAGSPLLLPTWSLVRGLALLPGLALLALAPRLWLAALALLALGLRGPAFWLKSREAAETKAFLRLLPDALDLLTVSVEAGLGFDAALAHVAEASPPPLGPALARVLAEIRLGRPRRDALNDLAAQVPLPEVRQLVAAILHAEELGVGLGRTLRVQADGMRLRRKQKAEEAALKTPVKLLFPLVLFIFPTLFTVLLGPALLRFFGALGHGL
jgi:tight adherence protein C